MEANVREPETLIEWARHYAGCGHPVLPLYEMVAAGDGTLRCACGKLNCEDAGKHPRTAHGFHDATTDLAQIQRWWTQWPNANIALRTGDGLLVLDVDVDKGGDDSLEMLERRYAKLPATREAISGSRGRHYWFRLPDGVQIGSFNGIEDGVDVRGDGGYIIVEPSTHRSGNTYRWDGLRGFEEPVAHIPEWLLNLFVARRSSNGDGEPWRQISITVNRHPELPQALVDFIEADSDLAKLWNLSRADFGEAKTGRPNFSRYDLALAGRFVKAGVGPQQVADILTAFRLRHGDPKRKAYRLDYLQRTLYRVLHGEAGHADAHDRIELSHVGGTTVQAESRPEQAPEAAVEDSGKSQPIDGSPEPKVTTEPPPTESGPSGGDSNTDPREAGPSGKKQAVPESVAFLVARVEATRDFELVYGNISSLATLAEEDLAIVYQRLKTALGSKLNPDDFQQAIKGARTSLAQKLAEAPASEPADEPKHPYREIRGNIFRMKKGRDGGEEYIPLTNFTARIASDIEEDDGAETKRFFGIAAMAGQRPYSFIIPASEFSSLDWAIERIGPHAIVQPNQAQWARAAIQSLSTNTQPKRIYIHTGWRKVGASMLYLHGAGAIGANGAVADVDVRLSGSLAHYALLLPENREQLVAAIRASLKVLEVAPGHIGYPLLAAVYRAVFKSCDFVVWFGGPTGVFKSEMAALAVQHYGATMNSRRLPANFGSTGNALEMLAFTIKDSLLVIDDFAPHGSMHDIARYHAAADHVLRSAGNNQGRGRLSSDARLRQAKPPRGLILATGEDMPRGQSIRGRTFMVEVAPGDVNTAVLTECQVDAAGGLYARAMGAFVQWMAGQYDDLQATFQTHVLSLRSKATRVHSRTPGIVADLQAGFELFLEFATVAQAITVEEKTVLAERCWAALNKVAKAQRAQQDASEPAGRFLDLLRAAILSGQAYVAGLDGGAPGGDGQWGWSLAGSGEHERLASRGKCVGWLDRCNLYLEPTASFGVAQDLGRSTGEPLVVGQTTLKKRLKEKGLLASTDVARETLTVRHRICGEYISVLHLRADVLAAHDSTTDAKASSEPVGEPEIFAC